MHVASISATALPDQTVSDRRDLIEWAEPIIADRVHDLYRAAARDAEIDAMAAQHRRLWRNVILDQRASIAISRKELKRSCSAFGLPLGFTDVVDQEVMEELFDVVMARSQASRSKARNYGLILMTIANNLGAARVAA